MTPARIGMAIIASMLTLATATAVIAGETTSPAPTGGTAARTGAPCVEVRIGAERAGLLDCLNDQFKQAANAPKPGIVNTLGATSAPTEIGLYNESAVRERMGSNFGVSAQPQRPTSSLPRNALVPR